MAAKRKESTPDIGKKHRDELMAKTAETYQKQLAQNGVTLPKIIKEYAVIAFSDIQNHITIDESGAIQAQPLEAMGKHSRCVRKVKEHTTIKESADGSAVFKDSRVEYELYDKLKALDALREFGWPVTQQMDVNHSGSIMAAVAEVLSRK